MPDKINLSVVIPVYNEEENIAELSARLTTVCRGLGKSYEILYVDDGSKDGTLEAIKKAKLKDKNIYAIRLAKNFGKAGAYGAGFHAAQGDIIITMDGDLQDRPEQIPDFLKRIDEGYDLVTGWKYTGKGKRAVSSKLFNSWVQRLTKLKDIHDTNCPFKAYRAEIVSSREENKHAGLWIYGNLYRFIPAMAFWKGYRVTEIKVENDPRRHGQTKYGPARFVGGFLDLLTVIFLTQYIKRPMYFFAVLGLPMILTGILLDSVIVIWGLVEDGRVGHFALLILGLVAVIIGIQFIFTGLLAEMIVRLHQEQRRDIPIFIKY
ncbi:glycosyltransferase family 2 protein [candidate division TA06 bacterium]|uniref:Glycosyltransferase family 2 protein n=1 Tax=candidate division TA06 bacterium TaxID=2250710 RepID=A0A933I7I4_UNCT6|nr:glycosyltransferase family 2 protein [candidate division TA06 bacterium]